jgi:hypothetical protein
VSGRARTFGPWMMSPVGLHVSNRETLAFLTTLHSVDPDSRDYMFGLMSKLTNALVAEDCTAMIEYATSDMVADACRVGMTGDYTSRSFGIRLSFLRSWNPMHRFIAFG